MLLDSFWGESSNIYIYICIFEMWAAPARTVLAFGLRFLSVWRKSSRFLQKKTSFVHSSVFFIFLLMMSRWSYGYKRDLKQTNKKKTKTMDCDRPADLQQRRQQQQPRRQSMDLHVLNIAVFGSVHCSFTSNPLSRRREDSPLSTGAIRWSREAWWDLLGCSSSLDDQRQSHNPQCCV